MPADIATPARPTLIAAHRAGAALWPENSIMAFRNALELDVEFIEFDVHRSRDGVLVVHHDAKLGRTADGQGAIAEMDWADLKLAPLHGTSGDHMPLLASVLSLFDGSAIRPRLELKRNAAGGRYGAVAAEVMTMLRATGLADRAVISSFDPEYLGEAREAGARNLLWLLDREATARLFADVPAFAAEVLGSNIGEVAVRGADATADMSHACRKAGLTPGAYAGKDMDFERLLGIGLNVFTTDRPDLAIATRDRLRRG